MNKSLFFLGFPPGTTVDELKKYGRRRQPSYLKHQDNLHVEEGIVEPYKSEYKRRYRAYGPTELQDPANKDLADKENSSYEDIFFFLPDYKFSYLSHSRKRPVFKRPPNNLEPLKDLPMDFTTEKNSQYVIFPHPEKRKLLRRSTALKPEGEMTNETEVRKEYKLYSNPERAQMIRRLPSLKLEGKFESLTTEQHDQFIAFLLSKRPIIEKKKTLLKMEGDFDFLTEKNLSYVPHENSERPRIRKRSTSLKLDGELEFFPEYRESFVDFTRTRPITYRPDGNLRNDGDFEKETETKTQFVNFDNARVAQSAKPENNLRVEGEMEIAPEYKQSYVDFPRERPFLRRPLNQIKPEGNLQILTESSERFTELQPSEKSASLRRPSNLKLEGTFDFLSEQSDKFKKHESPEKVEPFKAAPNLKLEGEMDFVTEKTDKFVALIAERDKTGRRPSSLKLDGEFLLLPEGKSSITNFKSSENFAKPARNFRSNPTSPRKKPKEGIKFNLEEDKKFILGTPRRRLVSNRLNKASVLPEKNLKFDLPPRILPKLQEPERKQSEVSFEPSEKAKAISANFKSDGFPGKSNEPGISGPKKFQAFQVLDVKGQLGCQTMLKDILDSDKSISEEENSTYRLEVSNSEKADYHKGDWKIFPTPAMNAELREEAERRARKRSETFEKIVKSPKVPNYLLEENNNDTDKCWKTCGKLSPLFPPDNLNQRAFVVLNESRGNHQQSKKSVKKDKNHWEMPDWMSSPSIA